MTGMLLVGTVTQTHVVYRVRMYAALYVHSAISEVHGCGQ